MKKNLSYYFLAVTAFALLIVVTVLTSRCCGKIFTARAAVVLNVDTEEPAVVGQLIIPAKRNAHDPVERQQLFSDEEVYTLKRECWLAAKAAKKEQPEPEPVLEYIGRFRITGYDCCVACCGKSDGITASGTTATVGRTCAASKDFAFGTRLYIEGLGERVVEDRGGFAANTIDVLCEDHAECYSITGFYDVYIVKEAQG